MSKCDITIARSMTINCSNYSSIKPSVSITLKDIDTYVASEKYEQLAKVLDVLMLMETVALGNEIESCNTLGYKKFIENLEKVDNALEMANNILETL